jgi:hypothetical protein
MLAFVSTTVANIVEELHTTVLFNENPGTDFEINIGAF